MTQPNPTDPNPGSGPALPPPPPPPPPTMPPPPIGDDYEGPQ